MDTNSKNKGYLHASIITISVAIIFAIVTLSIYIPLTENKKAEDDFSSYLSSSEFAHMLGNYTNHILRSKYDEIWSYRYLDVNSIKYYFEKQGEETEIETNIGEMELEKVKENSLHHFTLWFDEEGRIMQTGTVGIDRNSYQRMIEIYRGISLEDAHAYEYTFIIPEDFDTYKDIFTFDMKAHHFLNYQIYSIISIAAISLILVILAALAVPYSYQSKVTIHRIYNKMFLELKALTLLIIFAIFAVAFILGLESPLARELSEHRIVDLLYSPGIYFYLISAPIVITVQLQLYMTVVYLKYVYNTGFYKGFVLNSFFIKAVITALKKLKSFIKDLLSLDIRDNYQNTILKIVVVNMVILIIISMTSFIGFFLAVIYSAYLFKYLSTFFKKIKEIHQASEEISKGNFDIAIDENDMGILTPIVQNINKIKSAFKLAIQKELKSQRLKNELITNVSHDLKTPLTSIITYIDLLKKEESMEKQQEYLEIIDKKSNRLKILIEDLFEASKTSSGNIDLQIEEVDVIALFRQTMGELEDKMEASSLQFKITLPEEKVVCRLDGRRTYRIFENIMSNILKYSMDNSRVYIDVQEGGETVTFIFKNISSYEMNFDVSEIIGRFSRGDKSRNTEGSGLGLAITKDLVELQKGEIELSIDGDLFKIALTFTKL